MELFSSHFSLGAPKGSGNCADPHRAGFACQSSQITTSVTHCGCYVLKARKSNFLITFPFAHILTFANPSCNFPLKQPNVDFLFQQDRFKYLQSLCHLSSWKLLSWVLEHGYCNNDCPTASWPTATNCGYSVSQQAESIWTAPGTQSAPLLHTLCCRPYCHCWK